LADGAQASGAVGAGGHFDRFNAFVTNGWAGVIGKAAAAMWLAYLKHADNDTGISYPGGGTLATMIGYTSTRHIARLRAALVANGLIEVVELGGGRDRPCKVRVLVPGAVPAKHSQAEKHSHHGSVLPGVETLPRRARKHSQGARANTPRARAPSKEELPKELPKEQTIFPAGAPAEAPKPARKAKERKLTDEQNAAWREFTDDWTFRLWPKYHDGGVYDFRPVDGKKSLEVMRDPRFYFKADVVKAMAELFMRDPEIYGNWDHTMSRFHQKRGWYYRLWRRRQQEGTSHVIQATTPDGAARDDYAIPTGRAREARPGKGADGDGQGAAAAG
jgi:hypothetical protein